MNFKNLEIGLIVANYPAMCTLLEDKPKAGGKSKQLQERKWKNYIDWEKDGHKYIITKIRNIPLPKEINKSNLYANDILSILINLFTKNNDKKYYTTNELLFLFGFTNNNYKTKITLSDFNQSKGYSLKQLQYLYNSLCYHITTHTETHLFNSLNLLNRRQIIKYEIVYTIKYLNENKNRLATKEEVAKYKQLYEQVKKSLNITRRLSFYNAPKFYAELTKELNSIGIEYCYKLHSIKPSININAENLKVEESKIAKQHINTQVVSKMIGYANIETEKKEQQLRESLKNGLEEDCAELIELFDIPDKENSRLQYELDIKKELIDFYIKITNT